VNRLLARTLVAAILTAAISACQPPAPAGAPPPDYAATLGPMTDKFMTMWDTKNYDLLDSILAPDFRRTAPDQNAASPAEQKQFITQVHTAYPDFHIVVDESAYKENLGFIQWTVTGTNTGDAATKATGKPVKISGVTMLKFRDGKITEEIVFYDTATLKAQLGTAMMPHAK